MIVMFKWRSGPDDEWVNVEDWDAGRVPGKGELARVDGREMRVLEILQDGPTAAVVYLVPTYVTI